MEEEELRIVNRNDICSETIYKFDCPYCGSENETNDKPISGDIIYCNECDNEFKIG